MKISVVTISFNQVQFLERAIRSVIGQKEVDFEYIIVDPGSTDGSRNIIEKYKEHFHHIILEPDNGPADGLNRGFSLASGDVFCFVNADDGLMPGALRDVAATFESRPDADVVYGHGLIVDRRGAILRRLRSEKLSLRRLVLKANTIMQQSVFVRSEAYRRVGGFNASNRICWDTELWLDLALSGAEFLRQNKYWSFMSMYDGTITSGLNIPQMRAKENSEFRRLAQKAFPLEPSLFSEAAMRRARLVKYIAQPSYYVQRIFDSMIPSELRRRQPELWT
jgi:glycosyltransferase involved in cell wall biosynthesis